MTQTMINVLFVCAGNICRSPMADAVFQHMIDEAGLNDKIKVDSAGTISYHAGERADHRTRAVLKKYKINYDGRARQFRAADVDTFDYILTMDRTNLSDVWNVIPDARFPINNVIQRNGRRVVIRPFLHYAYDAGIVDEIEVPDPYYSNAFEPVYQLVKRGCEALLDYLREEHNL